MTEDSVIDVVSGNKIIAEFMGILVQMKGNFLHTSEHFGNKLVKYHSSWDWLIPVVEKIEGMGYDTQIHRTILDDYIGHELCIAVEGKDTYEDGFDVIGRGSNKMEATYNGVTQFILWYNTTLHQVKQ